MISVLQFEAVWLPNMPPYCQMYVWITGVGEIKRFGYHIACGEAASAIDNVLLLPRQVQDIKFRFYLRILCKYNHSDYTVACEGVCCWSE
jgi:hypothetical protein